MKYTEFNKFQSVDALAEIIEPIFTIFANPKLKEVSEAENKTVIQAAKAILKENPKEILEVLAALDGTTVDEYECTPISLFKSVVELLQDKDLSGFFGLES